MNIKTFEPVNVFNSVCKGFLDINKKESLGEIQRKILNIYGGKKKNFCWLDLTKEDYYYIFVLILIERGKIFNEKTNYYCVEDISFLINEKHNVGDKGLETFKNKMLNGDIKVKDTVNNIILYSINYNRLMIRIFDKFMEKFKTCNVSTFYTKTEKGKSQIYKEWYYPNFCIKEIKLGEEVSDTYIFNLLDEINLICRKLNKK